MYLKTSHLAKESALKSVSERQAEILAFIVHHGEVCNFDIARGLNLDINRVTPRVKELREKKMLIDAGEKMSKTGRIAHYWRAVKPPHPEPRPELVQKQEPQKALFPELEKFYALP